MRLRTLPAVGIGVAALVLSTTVAGTATAANPDAPAGLSAAHKGTATAGTVAAPAGKNDCYNNLNAEDSLTAVSSQNFTDFGLFSSVAADFKCNSRDAANRKVTKVKVLGQYFNGVGPADSFNVRVYADKGGEPNDDKVKCSFSDQKYKESGSPGEVQTFSIPNRGKLQGDRCALRRGDVYWLEVQANMAFDPDGQWGWELSTQTPSKPADFKEDAFGTACNVYQNNMSLEDCIGIPGDAMFSVT